MGFADQYFSKQKDYHPLIHCYPSQNLRFVIVIPAFCEPDITNSFQAIWKCDRPVGDVEVIVVVNSAANADTGIVELNKKTTANASKWIAEHYDPTLQFHIIEKTVMPPADAGVGLARKTGMDEALYRFNKIARPDGYILSFDADSLCDKNYLTAIESSVNARKTVNGFTVYFEHPLSGSEFTPDVYQGITSYELHLRYVNQFLRFCGFPFAHHTVGSCFGVRADIYAAQGGMNKRKAGEDFYFLLKIIPLGNFIDINSTRIIPSPRESFRVPFGTGTAIGKQLASATSEMQTYSPQCFMALKQFFAHVNELYNIDLLRITAIIKELPVSLQHYLHEVHLSEAISEINANCSSPESFRKRFFQWFNAFRIIKYLNFASRDYFTRLPVNTAAGQFLQLAGYDYPDENSDLQELLKLFREIERGKE